MGPAPALQIGRSGLAAVRDGTVLIAGRRRADDVTEAGLERLDGRWAPLGARRAAGEGLTATTLPGGQVLLAGGGYRVSGSSTQADLITPPGVSEPGSAVATAPPEPAAPPPTAAPAAASSGAAPGPARPFALRPPRPAATDPNLRLTPGLLRVTGPAVSAASPSGPRYPEAALGVQTVRARRLRGECDRPPRGPHVDLHPRDGEHRGLVELPYEVEVTGA